METQGDRPSRTSPVVQLAVSLALHGLGEGTQMPQLPPGGPQSLPVQLFNPPNGLLSPSLSLEKIHQLPKPWFNLSAVVLSKLRHLLLDHFWGAMSSKVVISSHTGLFPLK